MSKQFERESPIDEVRILEEACMLAHQGDPRKLLELYHVHVSQSIRQMFSSNVTVDMTVDDLINDVAIRLARSNRLKRFDSVNMLRGYCVTVAKNVLKDKYRRSEREYRRLGSSFDDVGRHVDVCADEVDIDSRIIISQVIAGLPALHSRQREVIILILEGTMGRDAASKMGMNYNGYRELLHRARNSLSRILGLNRNS